MRAPILPYYGGEFMGVQPPQPITFAVSFIFNTMAGGNYVGYRVPCLDVSDGSYYRQDNTVTNLTRYNASNAILYQITVTQVQAVLPSADYLLGLTYASDNNYYALAYYFTSKTARLVRLSTSSNTLTALGGGAAFTTTNAMQGAPQHVTMWEQADGNLRVRCTSNYGSGIVDLVISKTGAKISEAFVSQAGRVIKDYPAQYLQYETADGTIQFGQGLSAGTSLNNTFFVIRNGKYALVPVSFISAAAGNAQPILVRRYSNYVIICQYSDSLHVGASAFLASDFDVWLHSVADKLGL